MVSCSLFFNVVFPDLSVADNTTAAAWLKQMLEGKNQLLEFTGSLMELIDVLLGFSLVTVSHTIKCMMAVWPKLLSS